MYHEIMQMAMSLRALLHGSQVPYDVRAEVQISADVHMYASDRVRECWAERYVPAATAIYGQEIPNGGDDPDVRPIVITAAEAVDEIVELIRAEEQPGSGAARRSKPGRRRNRPPS